MMRKNLSEMTLEELWQLFTIFLTEHQEAWKEWYLEEEKLLKRVLSKNVGISHIGSTAVSSIWAKPIIYILVEVPTERMCFKEKREDTVDGTATFKYFINICSKE